MLKYLNYASYLIIGLYSIYLFVVYISLKSNYLDKIRSKIINRFILKYEISNNKLDLNYDITFLVLVLTSVYKPKSNVIEEGCITNPFKKFLNN